jgi:hypothetical protein
LIPAFAQNDADQVLEQETLTRFTEANRQIGMPAIENFMERRFVKKLLELRDQRISTFSYLADQQAQLHFLCPSLGYGIPYSVQFTNPYRVEHTASSEYLRLPLPEPNALFTPEGLRATWVLCQSPTGIVQPVYAEPNVVVAPAPLRASSSYLPDWDNSAMKGGVKF